MRILDRGGGDFVFRWCRVCWLWKKRNRLRVSGIYCKQKERGARPLSLLMLNNTFSFAWFRTRHALSLRANGIRVSLIKCNCRFGLSWFVFSDKARLVPTSRLPLNPLLLDLGTHCAYGLIEAVALPISNIPFDVLRDVIAVFYAAYHVIVVTRLPSKINLNWMCVSCYSWF